MVVHMGARDDQDWSEVIETAIVIVNVKGKEIMIMEPKVNLT